MQLGNWSIVRFDGVGACKIAFYLMEMYAINIVHAFKLNEDYP